MASKPPFLVPPSLLRRVARLAAALALASMAGTLPLPARAQEAPPDASSTSAEQTDPPAADATVVPPANVGLTATPIARLTPARLVIEKLGVDATIV
ncbi:MAG: hypothetical protein IT307_06390, partial [Chloroflexi bacterium]|nr:hypothetical protein [Chloroflexota bacterium]